MPTNSNTLRDGTLAVASIYCDLASLQAELAMEQNVMR